jgi:hypothetical protein
LYIASTHITYMEEHVTPLHIQCQYICVCDVRQTYSADKKLCIQFPTTDTFHKSHNATFSYIPECRVVLKDKGEW